MTNKETMKSIHSPLIYLENLSNYFQLYPFLCPQPDWHVNILEQHSLLHIFWRISNFSFIYLCKFCNFKMCISLTFCFLSLFPLINNNAKIREAFCFVFVFLLSSTETDFSPLACLKSLSFLFTLYLVFYVLLIAKLLMQISLVGQLQLLSSQVTVLAVPSPSLTATLER